MFSKYYDFIQSKLNSIGYLGRDTTLSNYFKAVIGGFMLFLYFIAIVVITVLLLGAPIIAYIYLISKPHKKMKAERMNFIKESKEEISVEKRALMKEYKVEWYAHVPEEDERFRLINKKEDKMEEDVRVTCKEMKLKENKKLKKNIFKIVLSFFVYLPVVFPLLFILSDLIVGANPALYVAFWSVIYVYVVIFTVLSICKTVGIIGEHPECEYGDKLDHDVIFVVIALTLMPVLLKVIG